MIDGSVRPGSVAVMPLADGGFGACQVTGVDDAVVAVVALRWHSVRPPSLDDLAGAEPLRLDHHAHRGQLAHVCVSRSYPVPPDFAWVGRLPVPDGVPPLSRSYSAWQSLPRQVLWQRRWDGDLPRAARDAYRAAATTGPVDVDLGAGPASVGAAYGMLDLAGGRPVRVPATGAVRWSALDRLPRCTNLVWSGPDRGLGAALRERPVISTLTWRDAPTEVDLTGTGVVSVTVGGAALRSLRLPRGLIDLELLAPGAGLRVRAADDGRWLQLDISAATPDTLVPAGLHRAREVSVQGDGVISARTVAALPDVRAIRFSWRRSPGQLVDADLLAGLRGLATIELVDGYGVDPVALPDLPALRQLHVSGLRRSAATALRARYRRSDVRLVVEGAKGDTWLAANLDNPLRDWVDDDPRGGAAACRAYAAAVRAVDKLPPGGDGRLARAEQILHTLVDRLNRVEEKYEIIDTLRREQAVEAVLGLAARADVPLDVAGGWIDDWRDF